MDQNISGMSHSKAEDEMKWRIEWLRNPSTNCSWWQVVLGGTLEVTDEVQGVYIYLFKRFLFVGRERSTSIFTGEEYK